MLIIFWIQHRGIASTASAQKWLAILVLVPLLLVGLVPIFNGSIEWSNVTGLVPPTASYSGVDGTWNLTRLDALPWRPLHRRMVNLRLRDSRLLQRASSAIRMSDTSRPFSSRACSALSSSSHSLLSFQGVLGTSGMLAPGIVERHGVGEALAGWLAAASSSPRSS